MQEKQIAKGAFSRNILAQGCFGFSVVSLLTAFCVESIMHMHSGDSFAQTYLFPSSGEGPAVFFWLAVISFVLGILFYMEMCFCSITVTDKRVYGKAAFGKRVDLPLNKISSIGTSFPKGISVATSSGHIKFFLIQNQDEVFDAISELLKERQ